jgi:uncharacterized protein YneF (UPF0154 family)
MYTQTTVDFESHLIVERLTWIVLVVIIITTFFMDTKMMKQKLSDHLGVIKKMVTSHAITEI